MRARGCDILLARRRAVMRLGNFKIKGSRFTVRVDSCWGMGFLG